MERSGKDVAVALAVEGYVTVSATGTLCEVSGASTGFGQLLAHMAAGLHVAEGKVILQEMDGTRSMYCIRNEIVSDTVLRLPAVRAKHVRPIRPLEPRHTYFGIAPIGRGKWRAVVNTTDPTTHKAHVVTSQRYDNPETAAREHDRIAREYARKGMVGSRVHLNFPAGGGVTVAQN